MKLKSKNPVLLAVIFLWLGIFIAVSFLETPLKFQVPGMTLPVALELGKLMFGISTDIQLGLMIFTFIILMKERKSHNWFEFTTFGIICILMLVVIFWMLPVLDARADLLSAGKPVPPSELHNYFIYAESAKLILLVLFGGAQFQTIKTNKHSLI